MQRYGPGDAFHEARVNASRHLNRCSTSSSRSPPSILLQYQHSSTTDGCSTETSHAEALTLISGFVDLAVQRGARRSKDDGLRIRNQFHLDLHGWGEVQTDQVFQRYLGYRNGYVSERICKVTETMLGQQETQTNGTRLLW